MKIFGWMLNKRNRSEVSNKPNPESMSYDHMMQHHCKEVYSDWPNGLLAIGTLGNPDKLSVHANNENTASQVQDNFDEEEEEEEQVIDKELSLLLSNHISLDREKLFLDCSREDEEKTVHALENEDARIRNTTSSMVNKGAKDARLNNNNNKKKNGIGKKSISFLIKKALLCGGGFVLRDPLPDTTKVENSRMDKILRALLHKKIYPQRPTSKSGSKKYLDNRPAIVDSDDEEYEEAFRQSKWVKTDSEYIVLEI
ncbi:hypothetical protein ACP275_10G062800 [Erythranthe tilingii]